MNDDRFIRRVLWISAIFNLGGALAFAFPGSLGQLLFLPAEVPAIYRTLLAMFVILFGGAYAWLASQPVIDRPMVAFSAIGKATAFVAVLLLWVFGAVPFLTVFAMGGDLVLAALFARWLAQSG